jgi:hypothetical protein
MHMHLPMPSERVVGVPLVVADRLAAAAVADGRRLLLLSSSLASTSASTSLSVGVGVRTLRAGSAAGGGGATLVPRTSQLLPVVEEEQLDRRLDEMRRRLRPLAAAQAEAQAKGKGGRAGCGGGTVKRGGGHRRGRRADYGRGVAV